MKHRREIEAVLAVIAILLLACGCAKSPTQPDIPTHNEALAMRLAACYADHHGIEARVVWHEENRGDGGCAWAWNLDDAIHISSECINAQTADIDVAWIVAHEVCHKLGFPDDYNEPDSTLRFCINTTMGVC